MARKEPVPHPLNSRVLADRLRRGILILGWSVAFVPGTTTLASADTIIQARVSAGSDDAEERDTGTVYLTSSDLELVEDSANPGAQTIGIRFGGIAVPRGATIISAHIQFQTDEAASQETLLLLRGQASDNAGTFISTDGNISSRPVTAASVGWVPPAWSTVGEAGPAQRTPNLAPIIAEITARPGWLSGNSLVIVITGTGQRIAESYEGKSSAAPLLELQFQTGDPPGDLPPAITITSPLDGAAFGSGQSVSFTGSATDPEDGDLTWQLAWTSDIDGSIGAGGSFTRADLSVGRHVITATVTDSAAQTATAEVRIQIGSSPVVTISQPLQGAYFAPGDWTFFSAVAVDASDGDLTASLEWSSDIDGLIDGGATNDFLWSLSPGVHTIRASVIDSDGMTGDDKVIITVSDPVLLAAGDIATGYSDHDEETAVVLDGEAGTVLTLGDNVYEDGTITEFLSYYDPTWGRHKDRTYPAVGNHEYNTPGAAPYYSYFGPAAGDPSKGYYSFEFAAWHVVVLNSECARVGGCDSSSPQGQWLHSDLAAHPSSCTLAVFHRPRFSSVIAGATELQDFWQELYDARADVVLNGHVHHYERFMQLDPSGAPDAGRGIRQFSVGTGGTNLDSLPPGPPLPTSEVLNGDTYGVLKLTLRSDSYDWEFLGAGGGTFFDAGTGTCVVDAPVNSAPDVAIATPADGSSFVAGATVTFTGTAVDAEEGDLASDLVWTSSLDGALGSGASVATSTLSPGSHTVFASVTDSGGLEGIQWITVNITDPTGVNVWEGAVSRSDDDVEEHASGRIGLASTDLELLMDSDLQKVGLRFSGVAVPRGATVNDAWIQFRADEITTGPVTIQIHGDASDDAPPFLMTDGNVSNRLPGTSATVTWSPPDWLATGEAGNAQRTPNIAAIVQEIVDRAGWSSGNALVLMMTGSDAEKRTADSFDGGWPPVLHIEYTIGGPPPDLSPVANAGPDQRVTQAFPGQIVAITLDGSASADDGGTENLRFDWQWISGPVRVDPAPLGSPLGIQASADIGVAGTYEYRLTVTDLGGAGQSSQDSVQVMILPPGTTTTRTFSVASSEDDAEERDSGSVNTKSSDLELVVDHSLQTVGLRFADVSIPSGATITDARIQFRSDEVSTGPVTLVLHGEASAAAAPFTSSKGDLSSRLPGTSATVSWSPPDWLATGEAGDAERTPNIAAIIQEIVDRPDWSGGNALVVLITGTNANFRTADSYDGGWAPQLEISYVE